MVIPSSSSSSFIVERRLRSSSLKASFLLPRLRAPLSFLKFDISNIVYGLNLFSYRKLTVYQQWTVSLLTVTCHPWYY